MDQSVVLMACYSHQGVEAPLRPHRSRILKTAKDLIVFIFLTKLRLLASAKITETIYRCRGQVELVFKWSKQILRIKILGTRERGQVTNRSPSTLRTSRHRQESDASAASLYENPTDPRLTMFEKRPLDQLLATKRISD